MEPRLWVCITARKPWARELHLSCGKPAFVPKGDRTLSKANLQRQTQDPAQAGSRPPPSWPTFPLAPPESARRSDFRPAEARTEPRSGLTSGQQRPGLNPGGLLPSGLRAARQVQAAERGPHRGRSAPWPGLRPPGPTTACRPPADLSHPPQGPQRSPPAQADPCPPPHHRPCLQTWGNSGSRPGSVKLDSDVLAHWCG